MDNFKLGNRDKPTLEGSVTVEDKNLLSPKQWKDPHAKSKPDPKFQEPVNNE